MAGKKRTGIPALGKNIQSYAEQKEISLSEIAARSGVSVSYISRLCSGVASNPTLEPVMRIAAALQIPVSELLGEQLATPQAPDPRIADALAVRARELSTLSTLALETSKGLEGIRVHLDHLQNELTGARATIERLVREVANTQDNLTRISRQSMILRARTRQIVEGDRRLPT